MDRRYYSQRHFNRFRDTDTPETIAERGRYRTAAEQAVREREARYPVLTPENAREAIAWQEMRIKELVAAKAEGK